MTNGDGLMVKRDELGFDGRNWRSMLTSYFLGLMFNCVMLKG